MDYFREEITLLVQILKKQKMYFTDKLKACPPGGLNCRKRKGKTVYLQAVPDGEYENGTTRYVRKQLEEGSPLLRRLVLKEYLRVALHILDHNIRCLEKAKARLLPLNFETIRKQMRKGYDSLADTILFQGFLEEAPLLDNGTFLRQRAWAAQKYEQSKRHPENKTRITSRGLRVRSRAELLIAELLYRYEIPFRYEQVLHIGKHELAPDFTFLDVNGEEFYWEHCGMMSDPSYVRSFFWRRDLYDRIGITEWTNMIYTFDLDESIDMREIEAVVRTKILPRVQGMAA